MFTLEKVLGFSFEELLNNAGLLRAILEEAENLLERLPAHSYAVLADEETGVFIAGTVAEVTQLAIDQLKDRIAELEASNEEDEDEDLLYTNYDKYLESVVADIKKKAVIEYLKADQNVIMTDEDTYDSAFKEIFIDGLYPKEESWKEELSHEYRDLTKKIIELSDYILSEDFRFLEFRQQKLLHRQLRVMLEYREVLEERCNLVGIPFCELV